MNTTSAVPLIPVISAEKNYWLIRTQGGRYYNDYKSNGFIAINWDDVSIEDIENLSVTELGRKVKLAYPDKRGHGRTANQLRIFSKLIKKSDTVIITSHSSNRLTIGEVLEDTPYIEIINEKTLEENNHLCPFQKRKKVRWGPTYHKYEIDIELFRLLQHAQHTISSANEYADTIEGLTHNFFIRGNSAYLALRVKKDGKIPMFEFFPMGTEILNLALEFNQYSKVIQLNIEDIETKVNVNSPGKIKLKGTVVTITVIGMLLVGLAGGRFTIKTPETLGGLDIEISTDSLIREVNEFLDSKQQRDHQDKLLKQYMNDLEVDTPDELKAVFDAVSNQKEEAISSEVKEVKEVEKTSEKE